VRLADDLREFVELLLSKKVDFVVVGAYALGYHKLPRYTGDIDILIGSNPDNGALVVEAIKDSGFGSLGLRVEDFIQDDRIAQLGIAPNRVDLLTSISGVGFQEAWNEREEGDLDGLHVPFLSARLMIQNKLASGRDQDLIDVRKLRERMRDA
jgi:hypothetical protein